MRVCTSYRRLAITCGRTRTTTASRTAGESGISGVTVKSLDGVGGFVATTTTDGTGFYHFTALQSGNYQVEFANPGGGYVFTGQDIGSDVTDSDANASGKTGPIVLPYATDDNTVDAGLYKLSSIGDYVWEDKNYNGQQDGGESGISGVTVKLLDGVGGFVATTTTDGTGFYHFTALQSGNYQVEFANPGGGYVFTGQDIGSDVTDSDANASGKTGPIVLPYAPRTTTPPTRVCTSYRRLAITCGRTRTTTASRTAGSPASPGSR